MSTISVKYFQVSAFARGPFSSNPAGVVLLPEWLPAARMQAIAAELGQPTTAFVVAGEAGHEIRWFTPTVQDEICGHASLAAAWVLFRDGDASRESEGDSLTLHGSSGPMTVVRDPYDRLTLSMPARPGAHVAPSPQLVEALGFLQIEDFAARYYLAVLPSAQDVRELPPEVAALGRLDRSWVVVTAPGEGEFDCVSRYFGPGNGIPEDLTPSLDTHSGAQV